MENNLSNGVLQELVLKSRSSPRKRAVKNFQEDSYPGPQLGLNIIQPDSYMRPHLRYSDEHIIWYSGKLCSLIFKESGRVERGRILSKESSYLFLPKETYHSLISLEEDSAIWFITQGPFDPNKSSEFLPNTPGEKENYQDYFQSLKEMMLILKILKATP